MEDINYDRELFEEISNQILLNYELAECLVPKNLKREFRNQILPWRYIRNELLPYIIKYKTLEITGIQEQIKRMVADRICIKGFGVRCERLGRLPEEIYAELTRGLFLMEA